jgi:hypothetical protein
VSDTALADIAEACGEKWQNFIANREGRMQTILDETGFRERLVSIGAWGGKDPKKK